MGVDARTATAERGEEAIASLVDRLVSQIEHHLQ
jgi:creatinine amidohydrolase/Fe(II)-dependent formamide hydrolase-like protein